MIDKIWSGMILIGIIFAAAGGNLDQVTNGLLDGAMEGIELGITMLGTLCFWCGLMEIAKKAGIIRFLCKWMEPLVHFLFPHIPKGHKSISSICTNIVANLLGLGMAATPAGIEAMHNLKELEEERKRIRPLEASDEMCTLLVINISSLQLIPMSMIAYRAQYGSLNPTAIMIPGLIATAVSTGAGIIYCRIACKKKGWLSRTGRGKLR